MRLMKGFLWFQVFLGEFIGAVYRFIGTILWGEDEAFRRAQAATVEWAREHADKLGPVARLFESPVRCTMPEPDRVDAEFIGRSVAAPPGAHRFGVGVVFGAGPYRILRKHPPNETCPYWRFDFEGPGFEGGHWSFIGVSEGCGESNIGGLATAYAVGQIEARREMGVPCPTR